MDELQKPLDLELWLNKDLIRRQNLLKRQFLSILEEVGSAFSNQDLAGFSQKSRGVKISKGNDLLGFPYQVLDLIRDFEPARGVNIRILNWFGHGVFVTVLLGKSHSTHISSFSELGFAFGLAESPWDYADLILNKNQTIAPNEINESELGFRHWIKTFEIQPNPTSISALLIEEIKKILGILRLAS